MVGVVGFGHWRSVSIMWISLRSSPERGCASMAEAAGIEPDAQEDRIALPKL